VSSATVNTVTVKATGAVTAQGGLYVDGVLSTHPSRDGSFYKYSDGQVYLATDDWLYLRHTTSGTNAFTFDLRNTSPTLSTTGTVSAGTLSATGTVSGATLKATAAVNTVDLTGTGTVNAPKIYASTNMGVGTTGPEESLHVLNGDIKVSGGYYRRLKVVSDDYWAGLELVTREQKTAGRPHIDFTHGDLDNPNFGIRFSCVDNTTMSMEAGAGSGTMALNISGLVSANGLMVDSQSSAHLEKDGAFYRYGGQVYVTVDDWLYIRKTNSTSAAFAFNTSTNSLTIGSWTITDSGGSLIFEKTGVGNIMRLDNGQDKVQFYKNNNGAAPYFYYNKDGNYGTYNG
jgi:hypothetical protein